MRYLSVCSGIEAATVAWHPLGWTPVAFAEIDPFACAVLRHHYPGVPNRGDFTAIDDCAADLLVGGTPCQDFSVAGLRAGLAGARGHLTLEFLALAGRARPRWLVWENVPGVLSADHGWAFGTFLGLLGELGYGWAYRVLDAQHFGVPQRRRRVFVVGHRGDWRRAAAVLFERHCLSGHPAPRREAGEGVAPCLRGGASSSSNHRKVNGSDEMPMVAATLAVGANYLTGFPGDVVAGESGVAHSLRADGLDAGEDGTGRGTPLVPVSFDSTWSGDFGLEEGDLSVPLKDGHGTVPAIAFDTTQITSDKNYSQPRAGDARHPLAAGAHAPAIAFGLELGNQGSGGNNGWHGIESPERTLDTNCPPGVASQMAVRRLTPEECEALQGFPSGYTLVPYRGKPAADGPRYRALGNSMAVPVMRWIGRRIQMVEEAPIGVA